MARAISGLEGLRPGRDGGVGLLYAGGGRSLTLKFEKEAEGAGTCVGDVAALREVAGPCIAIANGLLLLMGLN